MMTTTTTMYSVRPIETGSDWMEPLETLGTAATPEEAEALCEQAGYVVRRDGGLTARTDEGETSVWCVTVWPSADVVRAEALVEVRSDLGDGGWSLHAPGATDDAIATGEAPALLTGTATWDAVAGGWDAPTIYDRLRALARLA